MISVVLVHKVKNRIKLRMAEVCSTAGSTESSHVLGLNCTPAHQIRNQLFYYLSTPLADLNWLEAPNTAAQYPTLFFQTPMEHQYSSYFWTHACIELQTILEVAMFSLMQTYKFTFFLSYREMSTLCCIIFMTVITQLGVIVVYKGKLTEPWK